MTDLSIPQAVRGWLAAHHTKQLSLLDKFEQELRLGRLSTSFVSSSTQSDRSGIYGGIAGRDRRLVTSRTVELLRTLIGSTKWKTPAQLMTLLKGLGRELHAAGGFREPAIGNIVRRIMCAVRDEAMSFENPNVASGRSDNQDGSGSGGGVDAMNRIDEMTEASTSQTSFKSSTVSGPSRSVSASDKRLSLTSILWAHPQNEKNIKVGRGRRSDSFSSVDSNPRGANSGSQDDLPFHPSFYVARPLFRQTVMEAIQEIINELEDLHKNIDDQVMGHVHSGEVIMTYGRSKTIESFLKAAATKKLKFQVIACEAAPHFGGHGMAKALASANIDTTIINDSATFAIMSRVNKVLLPAHAVLVSKTLLKTFLQLEFMNNSKVTLEILQANGGLIAPSGSHMVALAANQNAVPVVCITGMFKLCPMYPHEGQNTLQDLVSPSSIIDFAEMTDSIMANVEYIDPVHDYIPPQLINLYVTNVGAFQPSYIYRLLAEYYHTDDWESFE